MATYEVRVELPATLCFTVTVAATNEEAARLEAKKLGAHLASVVEDYGQEVRDFDLAAEDAVFWIDQRATRKHDFAPSVTNVVELDEDDVKEGEEA
jgi:hypothetical protein